MAHPIRCQCGKVAGTLNNTTYVNRCVCYCDDCQAFARFLKRDRDILDDRGGTSLVQTIPANITLTQGREHLTCVRLSDKGLFRWYAACCNTPMGNTLPTINPSFVGLAHTCLSPDRDAFDEAFGASRMHVNTQDAIGEDKPKERGVLPGTLRVVGMMLKARLDGSYKRTPFFDPESGTPVVAPKVLSDRELESLKQSSS